MCNQCANNKPVNHHPYPPNLVNRPPAGNAMYVRPK